MRFIKTNNSIAEFIETDKTGKIISSRGFQFGVIYFEIKNKKVAFYLDNDEQPFQNFVWSTDIPLTIDDVEYETEEEVSAALHSIFNDRFQEQLDQLKEDLAAEEARAQEAEAQLDDKIDDESARAIAAENRLQDQVTELSGAVAVLDNRVTNVENDLSALTDTVNDEISRSVEKDAEHDTQISGLTNTLNSEIQRALSAETQLHNEIINEQNRALAAESGITANLNSEISRSTEKDAQHDAQISALTVSLDNEINRATTAENSLRSDLNDEIADRISGDTNLQNQLNAEIARAQNAEEDIYDKIDAEIARANSEETRIEGKLDNEITRSTAKDASHDTLISGLTTSLQNEINRATTAENSLRNDLNAEISRATNAENTLDDKIDVEIQNRINAISGLTERVADDEASTGAALVDLNDKANALSGENASQNVQISGLNNSINTEISRATSVENALRNDLTNETSARTNADAAMLERIVAVEVGKADANSVYTKAESDNKYATKDYISGLTDEFQVKLVAGDNISIVGNVISATGSGGGITPEEVQEMIDGSISGKADSDDVYTKNEVYTKAEVDEAIDDIDLSGYYTKSEVDASQLAQDNKINAISGDVQTLNEKVETISGESVTSGEVQTQINDSISGKADKTEIYTYVGTDRIKVTNTTGIRRKAIDLNIPIYKGSGMESLSLGAEIGTAQGANQIKGYYSTGIGLGLTTNNSSEVATGQYNISNTVGITSWGSSGNTLFSIGNGDHQGDEHNAFEVRQNGDIYISSGGTTSSHMFKLQDALGQGGGGVTPTEVQTMIDNSISGKADTSDVYSKTEVYTKTEVDNKVSVKPNVWCGNESEWSQISGSTESGTIYLVY